MAVSRVVSREIAIESLYQHSNCLIVRRKWLILQWIREIQHNETCLLILEL